VPFVTRHRWLDPQSPKNKKVPPVNINDYPAVKLHLDSYWTQIENLLKNKYRENRKLNLYFTVFLYLCKKIENDLSTNKK
jgi:hypothetical protein